MGESKGGVFWGKVRHSENTWHFSSHFQEFEFEASEWKWVYYFPEYFSVPDVKDVTA